MMVSLGSLLIAASWLFLAPSVGAALWWPGLLCVAIGATLVAMGLPREGRSQATIRTTAVAFALSFVTVKVLHFVFLYVTEIPGFAAAGAAMFGLIGREAASGDGMIALRSGGEFVQVAVTPQALGFAHFAAVAVTFFGISTTGTWKRGALVGACLVAGMLLKFVVMVECTLAFRHASYPISNLVTLWDPWWSLAGMAPLMLIVAGMGSGLRPTVRTLSPTPALVATGIGALFLSTLTLAVREVPRQGRLLIDDVHSGRWESSTAPFDTYRHGPDLAYTFGCARRYLTGFYDVEVNAEHSLDRVDLSRFDAVMLKTPTTRYSKEEIAAIHAFVNSGGGLVLIGDHTNLLGMSTFFNELVGDLGLRFGFDAVNSITHGHFNESDGPGIPGGAMAPAFDSMRFMTSCSLRVDASWEVLMTAGDGVSIRGSYSSPSFFGESQPGLADRFGQFVLSATRPLGSGRIVAIADSTPFSNFAINMCNRDETLARLVACSVSRDRIPLIVRWSVALIALGLAAFVVIRRRQDFATIGCGVAAAMMLVGALQQGLGELACPLPEATRELPVAYVVVDPAVGEFPDAMGHYHGKPDHAFDTVFISLQRFGYIARSVAECPSNIGKDDLAVFIRPDAARALAASDLSRRGVPVVILEDERRVGEGVRLSPAREFSRVSLGTVMDKPDPKVAEGLERLYAAVKASRDSAAAKRAAFPGAIAAE